MTWHLHPDPQQHYLTGNCYLARVNNVELAAIITSQSIPEVLHVCVGWMLAPLAKTTM